MARGWNSGILGSIRCAKILSAEEVRLKSRGSDEQLVPDLSRLTVVEALCSPADRDSASTL